MFDAAHIAGLIAGGVHPRPVPYADVVTFTTHKTLRGPRGGCILSTAEHATAIDKAVFPGLQGGPLEHVIAAQGGRVPRGGAPEFKRLRRSRSCANAAALAAALAGEGFRLVSGGTDNHLMLVDLRTFDAELTGKKAQDVARPGRHHAEQEHDPRRPAARRSSRAGCASAPRPVTTQGMNEPEMAQIAELIARALRHRDDEAELAAVRDDVDALCSKFAPYPG